MSGTCTPICADNINLLAKSVPSGATQFCHMLEMYWSRSRLITDKLSEVLEGNMANAGNMAKSTPCSYFHGLSTATSTVVSRMSSKVCL